MTFEERQLVRHVRSEIQREKEKSVRRMHVMTTYGTKLYLGGGSRPYDEQSRAGYPISPTEEDSAWGIHNRKKKAA